MMKTILFALALSILPLAAQAQTSQATITLTVTIPGDVECNAGCTAMLRTDPTSAANILIAQQRVLNAGRPPHPSCAPNCTKTNVVAIMAAQFAAQGAAFAAQALGQQAVPASVTPPSPTSGEATP